MKIKKVIVYDKPKRCINCRFCKRYFDLSCVCILFDRVIKNAEKECEFNVFEEQSE